MMFQSRLLLLPATLFFFSLHCTPALAYTSFHPAASDAEKTLDSIIQFSQQEAWVSEYLLRHGKVDAAKEKLVRGYFTPALLRAFRDSEANMVHEQCGGSYVKGETCGIRYNPVSCLEYERNAYFYRTDSGGQYNAGEYNAVVAYRLPEGQQIIATYNLLKVGTRWKLDGVDCTLGHNFNM